MPRDQSLPGSFYEKKREDPGNEVEIYQHGSDDVKCILSVELR